MTELLERSAYYIDEGIDEGPGANNPTDGSFHEVADGVVVVAAFSHVWALRSAGAAAALSVRAVGVVDAGELRLACQLAEWAGQAAPDELEVCQRRAELYRGRREAESSLMSKGMFGTAAQASEDVAGG